MYDTTKFSVYADSTRYIEVCDAEGTLMARLRLTYEPFRGRGRHLNIDVSSPGGHVGLVRAWRGGELVIDKALRLPGLVSVEIIRSCSTR